MSSAYENLKKIMNSVHYESVGWDNINHSIAIAEARQIRLYPTAALIGPGFHYDWQNRYKLSINPDGVGIYIPASCIGHTEPVGSDRPIPPINLRDSMNLFLRELYLGDKLEELRASGSENHPVVHLLEYAGTRLHRFSYPKGSEEKRFSTSIGFLFGKKGEMLKFKNREQLEELASSMDFYELNPPSENILPLHKHYK